MVLSFVLVNLLLKKTQENSFQRPWKQLCCGTAEVQRDHMQMSSLGKQLNSVFLRHELELVAKLHASAKEVVGCRKKEATVFSIRMNFGPKCNQVLSD